MDDLIRRSDAVKAIALQLAFNAEMKTAEEFSWEEFEGAAGWILEKCETVDAVPVVRCRDCKHFAGEFKRCDYDILAPFEYFYCLHGEREVINETN